MGDSHDLNQDRHSGTMIMKIYISNAALVVISTRLQRRHFNLKAIDNSI